jgi:RHS repeat-associated protein
MCRTGAVLGVIALLPGSLAQADAIVGGPLPNVKIWPGPATQSTKSVPGHNATPAGKPVTVGTNQADTVKYAPAKVTWPSGSAEVTLAAPAKPASVHAAVRPGAASKVGSLPVSVASADASSSAARSVSVSFATHQAATAAGINGVIFTVSRADGGSIASPTQVTLDYSSFASAYGGGYADRLKLVELPACALTTPRLAKCRVQTPVKFTNDAVAGTLTASVPVGASVPSAQSVSAHSSAATAGAMVLAATGSTSGGTGNYTATSLSQTGSWAGGGSSGAFTYSYPIQVPPTVGGSAPDVTLGYDSASVDGETSATNAQASWIGDGWNYSPGYVERSYQPCAQDSNAATNSSDLCWAGNAVTLSLDGQNEQLVDSAGTWRLQNDDGATVTALTGQANGAYGGEGWEITETDGTQYYFGANPDSLSSTPATDSTWTEPVYCPASGDGPSGDSCYNSTNGSSSYASNLAWRWNLDYVVDPNGNLTTYTWTPETNYYLRGYDGGANAGTSTLYTRGGYLSQIAYGYRVSDAVAGDKPLDTVTFNVGERCTPGYANCNYTYLTSNLSNTTVTANWPDTPADLICPTSSYTCTNYSPTYFETDELQSITTQVLVGSSYDPVDTYTLSQYFPDPQAGVVTNPTKSYDSPSNPGDGTVAVMWLGSIQRSGDDTLGGGAAVPEPATTFVPDLMPNRVDGTTTGYAALYRPRMDSITTSSGEQIVVSYSTPTCSTSSLPTPDTNTTTCFPQYWTPSGDTSPILDWFNTYQVSEVTENDLVAPAAWSQAQVTQYTYQDPAWHRDDSPLTENAYRTWDEFRGFQTVTTTVGTASVESVPTQTVSIYMQGMNGDYLANGTQRSVCVNDNVGDCVTDAPQLQGQLLETDTLDGVGGTVEKRDVNGPWTYTQTASEAQTEVGTTSKAENPATTLPSLTSEMLASDQTRTYQLWHDGTWKTLTTDDTYDTHGRLVTSDAKGDGTSAVPEVCTTTSYATSTSSNPNMLDYPDEIKAVQGACGTTATAANTVSDNLTFYDSSTTLGALTGAGNATETEAVDSYNSSGNPVYIPESKSAYDTYGRVTSATDADGNTTTTAYTTPGVSPDVVTTTNPEGWTSTVTLDPARGLTLASTDANGELTSYTYDGLGDVTAVWSPLHAKASSAPADKTFSYAFSNTAPTTVTTETLREDGSYAPTADLYDGLMREIQAQAPTADGETGRLITDTHYNSLGQTVKATSAYYNSASGPTGTVFVPANDSAVPQETETFYDGLGRTVETLTIAQGTNQWATTTSYKGVDETDTTPPAGGTATTTFVDALGRTIESWVYSTATPTDTAANATITTYTYTPTGKPATMTDTVGDTWSWTYDLHGNQIKAVDPGTGTSTETYDPDGNVLTSTDARGVTLSYTYDVLGRKTAEYDTTGGAGKTPADEQASWTYDTLEKGQPTSSITYTDGASDAANTYTESVTGYTALYQSTGESVTIPSAEGDLAGTYSDSETYTSETSLLAGTHYNAEGSLPKEQVNYGYSLSGILTGFGGTQVYLNTATYNPYGQILATNFGAYGEQLDQDETYDADTGRLLNVTDSLQTSTTAPIDDTNYTYNQAGNITSESNLQAGDTTPDTQCFTYDNLDQLTAAYTDAGTINTTTGSTTAQVFGIGGCADTSATAGKIAGGPAPYAETYSYDALGDRVGETQLNTTTAAVSTTQSLSYDSYNASTGVTSAAATPDAVQKVTTTTPTGTETDAYGYTDGNGDTNSRTVTTTGTITAGPSQTIAYNPQGLTQSVTDTATGTVSSYTYSADGTLLVEHDQASEQDTLYLPYGEQIYLNTGNGALTGNRYITASPDGITIVHASSGAITYELTDTQHTATTDVAASNLAVTNRYYDPYGNPRGTTPATWADPNAYLGQPQDTTTGLDLLGARQYDPTTGRFLSVDPVLEAGDQRQMNGYSYAGDNPVDSTDPTGTMIRTPNGCVGSVQACYGGSGAGGGNGAGNSGGGDSGSPTPPANGPSQQGDGPTSDGGNGRGGSHGSVNYLLSAAGANQLLVMRMNSIFNNPVAFLQDQMLAFRGGFTRGPEATADGCAPPLDGLCDSFDEIKNSFTNFLGTLSTGSSLCMVGCVGLSVSEGTPYLSVGGIGFGGLTKASLSTSQAPVSRQGPWQGVAGGAFDGGGGVTVGPEDPSSGNTIAWGGEGMTGGGEDMDGEGWQVGINVYIPISLDPNTWEQWFQSWSW